MKKPLLFAVLLCASAPSAKDMSCGGPKARAQMAGELYRQRDQFRGWVCETPCTKKEFQSRIEYHEAVFRDRPRTLGCFVEQANKTTQSATGVFVLHDSHGVLQFVFHGIGIGLTRSGETAKGYRVLEGRERPESDTWLADFYVWNGRAYVFRDAKTMTDPKSAE